MDHGVLHVTSCRTARISLRDIILTFLLHLLMRFGVRVRASACPPKVFAGPNFLLVRCCLHWYQLTKGAASHPRQGPGSGDIPTNFFLFSGSQPMHRCQSVATSLQPSVSSKISFSNGKGFALSCRSIPLALLGYGGMHFASRCS